MANLPLFPGSVRSIAVANVSLTTTQNVVQGGANGTILQALTISSNDTIDHSLNFSMNVGGVLAAFANVNIPANSGNGIVSSVNLFANNGFAFLPNDPVGNKYLYLANVACSLVASSNSLNGAAKVVSVVGIAGDF